MKMFGGGVRACVCVNPAISIKAKKALILIPWRTDEFGIGAFFSYRKKHFVGALKIFMFHFFNNIVVRGCY